MSEQRTFSSEARVATAAPRRYLAQLCKHFAHMLPATHDEAHGRIEFTGGTCTLEAEDMTLVLHLAAEDAAARERLEDVVARHLLRFAFREAPEVRWVRAP